MDSDAGDAVSVLLLEGVLMPRNGHNQGSVYQRSDGRWVAVVSVGYTSEGRQARKSFYAKTEVEAKRKLRQALATIDKGGAFGDDQLTVGAFLDRWLEDTVKPARAPSTYRGYSSVIRIHLKPGLGKTKLTKLTPAHVRRFLIQKTVDGCSLSLVKFMRVLLVNALNQALRDEIIVRNVAALSEAPKPSLFEASPLTVQEAVTFLTVVKKDRLEALYSVAISLGLRKGETLGFRWQDIDLDAGVMQVRNQVERTAQGYAFVQLKTTKSRRILPIPQQVVASIKAHKRLQLEDRLLAGSRWVALDLVFASSIGTPMDPSNLSKHFKHSLEKANISHHRFHDLRHSCGSFLVAKGVPQRVVMEILGHSQIGTTMNTYVHVDIDAMRLATDQMGELFGLEKASS